MNRNTIAIFIDLEKTFDKVDWKILFKILREKGINWKDRRFIYNLYKDQTTEIDVNRSVKEVKIRRGGDKDIICYSICSICSLK